MSLKLGLLASSINIAPSVTYLLDSYPGASVAYSLRKLRSVYNGSAIRVRRSSDNTEFDIGFTALGELNTTSLTTFVGGGNGFISIWYDQSGNGRDISQSTFGNQPQIVTSGVVNIQGSKPTLTFNGTTQLLTRTDTGLPTGNVTCIALTRTFVNPSSFYVHFFYGASSGGQSITLFYGPTDNSLNQSTLGVTNYGVSVGTTARSPNIYNLQYVLKPPIFGQWNQYINNTFLASFTNNANTTLAGAFNLGNGLGFYFAGNMQEVIIYPTQESATRTGIETNFNTYYTIY